MYILSPYVNAQAISNENREGFPVDYFHISEAKYIQKLLISS